MLETLHLAAARAVTAVPAGWDLESFLKNLGESAKTYGSWVIILIGVVMVITGVVKAGIGLMQHGKQPTNWFVIGLLIIVGGAMAVGGWSLAEKISSGGQATIDKLGGGTILLWDQMAHLATFWPW